jgi:hypothetical protein
MSDCQLKGPDNCQHITTNNENYDAQKSDEDVSDAGTIRMSSFEFWNGVDTDNDPDIPRNLIFSESVISTYGGHPGCQRFNCARLFQNSESTTTQQAKGISETHDIKRSA